MSKSAGYNRIVFLTTLSVYLGLVLVGGSACSLAHSATNKSFDIKNEIEFKDDLDNNPDKDIPDLFAELLKSIKENAASGSIALPIQKDFHVGGNFTTSLNSGGGSLGVNVSDQNLSLIIQNAFNRKFKPKALELADYKNGTKAARINLDADVTNFSLEVSFDKSHSNQFAEFLNREFSFSAQTAADNLLRQIYENTKASSENNQVFIITHLPRAAIDEFLAEKDASIVRREICREIHIFSEKLA